MLWQDIVLTLGSAFFTIALFPSVFGKDKPPLATSLPTGIIFMISAFTLFSLHLWATGIANSVAGALWLVLALQKLPSKKRKTTRK